jgi:hypothetical protein
VAILKGVDEYGPMLDWYTHWTTIPIGTKLYTYAPAAQPAVPEGRLHQCRKKPELKVLSFNRQEPELAAKGYVPVPLGRIAAPEKGQP